MKIIRLLFVFYILSIFLPVSRSSLSNIPEDLITTIKISELKNTTIKGESKIYTNNIFPVYRFFKIDFSSITDLSEDNNFSFLKITANIKQETSYKSLYLYINKTLYNLKESDQLYTDYYVQDKKATIFLPKKYFCLNKYLYFFIQGESQTDFIYTVETFTKDIIMKEKENKFNIYMKKGQVQLYYELNEDLPKGYFLISLLTGGVIEDGKEIYLTAVCQYNNDKSIGKYYPYFINGVGLLIEDNELINCKYENKIYLKINLNNDSPKEINIEFNSIYLTKENNEEFIHKEISENSIYSSLLMEKGEANKQCLKFKQNLEGRDIFYHYSFQVRSTSSDLDIFYYNEGEEKQNNKNIYFTGTIDMNIGTDKYLIICMQNNNKYNVGIQFQLIGKSNAYIRNLSKIPLLALINGFPTYFKLNVLEEMIFKIDTRQFLSNNKNTKKIVRFHLIKLNDVDMTLDHLIHKKFSDDNINSNSLMKGSVYSINRDMYLSYIFVKEKSLIYDEYLYASCNDEEKPCKFLLDVNLLDDIDSYPTQLIHSKDYSQDYYYKPISKLYIDKFKISLSNQLPENSKLVVILYMFSGDADLSLYDFNDTESNIDLQRVVQNTEYYSIGQKKFLIYNIKPFNKKMKYSLREIIIKINCLSGGFYSLRYYTIDEKSHNNNLYLSLPIGEINFDKITLGEGTKIYVLSSLLALSKTIYSNVDDSNEYYIMINSLNCVLDVEFMGKTYTNREIQIFFLQKDIKKNNLNIKIHELDSQSKDPNLMCVYYLSANSIEFQRNSITINEGVVHTMTLNEKIETVEYNYPYAYDDNPVTISLYKYYIGDLDVRVSINDKHTSNTITLKNIFYKKIVLYVNMLKKYCSQSDNIQNSEKYVDFINLCPINIYIRLPLKTDDKNNKRRLNKFQIEISSGGKTPSYIHNGEMRFDSVTAGQYLSGSKQKMKYIYYYTDIGKDAYPSEMILINKLGASEMVAKIVKKNEMEMFPNWDRRVRLPTIEDNDKSNYLKYNYELNKILINKKDLEKCQDGCEIYFGVFTRETSLYYQLNDFLIMFNKNSQNEPTDLLFNQNIDDSLTPLVGNKYYISHLENDNIDKLVFTFKSDYCSICVIMLDAEEKFDIDKMNKCTWKSDNLINGYKNYMFSIKSTDTKLKGKDLTSVKFVSKISSILVNNKDNLFYSLKINKENNQLPMVINVDSINNEIAQLDSNTGLAYYAIKIFEYQIINEIDLCVISDEKKINDDIVLYAKVIRQKEFNNIGFNQSLFNNNFEQFDIKSTSNGNIKNYLHVKLPRDQNEDDKIVFLVVKCNSIKKLDPYLNHYVKIMVSYYKPNANTSLKTNILRLYNMYIESLKFFVPLIKNKYSIVIINCLKGKGTITIENEKNDIKNEINVDSSDNKEYKIMLDLSGDYYYNFEDKFASIKIKNADENVNDNSFLFYITYSYKNIENNLENINPNKKNIIYYPIINNIPNHKSLAYYLNLNEINDINDFLIEINFNKDYFNEKNNLNTLGALINDEFIFQNIINEQIFIQSPLYSKSYYDSTDKKIYYLFKNNDITTFKKYFGYSFISFSNNIINYESANNQQKNNLYIEINIIPYNENKLKNSVEIKNKYSSSNKEYKEEKQKIEKSSSNIGLNIFLIIVFILIALFLSFRYIRKRKISERSEYFKNDFPNYD